MDWTRFEGMSAKIQVEYEKMKKFKEWSEKAPSFKFPASWEVKIIPPYYGAVCRFIVTRGKARVSVYLDVDNSLSIWRDEMQAPIPYWEAYPVDGDTFRCGIDDADALLKAIGKSLNQQVRAAARSSTGSEHLNSTQGVAGSSPAAPAKGNE